MSALGRTPAPATMGVAPRLVEGPPLRHHPNVALVNRPEDVSKRDLLIGLVCVAVLIVVAIVVLAAMISHGGGSQGA